MSADKLADALRSLLNHVDRETCRHEATHRGGSIWTICDDCSMSWADDRGGFVPYEDAAEVAQAREALAEHAASLAAPPAQGEWVLVPREPTDDMILQLMWVGLRNAEYKHDGGPTVAEVAQGYSAMLAAAPQPAPAPVQPARKTAVEVLGDPRDSVQMHDGLAQLVKGAQPPAPGEAELPALPINPAVYDLGRFGVAYSADQMHAYARAAIAALAQQRVPAPSAYCRACQAVGMSNCQHFDECAGATCITCHRPLNVALNPQPEARGNGE